MRTIIVDGAAYQRRILHLLLESKGIAPIEDYSSWEEIPEPGTLSRDDTLFIDAALYSNDHDSDAHAGTIIVTAVEKKDSLLAEKIELGAAAFLTKPFTREGLDRALSDVALMIAAS